tara:strand:+ start:29600 stop:30622 length:1023 start_codon:yes stop_codon:yes gene_type:complete
MFHFDFYKKKYIYIFFSFLAAFLSSHLSLDSAAYQSIFNYYGSSGWTRVISEVGSYEAFFVITAKLLNGFSSFFWFLIISLISVSLKIYTIEKSSRNFYISFVFYLAYFFVLLDGTQIRVSLAIAIAYLGLYLLSEKKIIKSLVLNLLSALFFHYSLVFILAIYVFKNKKTIVFLASLWPILILCWWLGVDFLSLSKIVFSYADQNWVGIDKVNLYLNSYDKGSAPYSLQFIFLFCASSIVYWRYRDELTDFEVICFNCVFMSLVVLGLFVGASGFQNRVSEIFRFGLIFIFPLYYRYCLEWVHKPWIANVLIGGFLIGYFYYYILRAGLIVWPDNWGLS